MGKLRRLSRKEGAGVRVLDAREAVEASAPRLNWDSVVFGSVAELFVTAVLMLHVFCVGRSCPRCLYNETKI